MKTIPELEFDLNLKEQIKDFNPKEITTIGYSYDKNTCFFTLIPRGKMIGAKTGKVRKRFLKPCARCEVQFRPKSSTGKLCEACIEKSKHRPKINLRFLKRSLKNLH